jgi:heme oxygenase
MAEQAFNDNTNASNRENTMHHPGIGRSHAMMSCQYFYGSEWKKNKNKQAMMNIMQPTPATQAYVAHVQEVAQTQPYLLVAHQYSCYLGDLFGT